MKVTQEQLNLLRGTLGELNNQLGREDRDLVTKECLSYLSWNLISICAKILIENAEVKKETS